ncbi:MAG TPA: mechanosensitive ion channel family protein, partial [Xanthobacteraceae bacterium]|nr:mechanosensitive ion channel family protein [Xanthobacteraceae bacterium]
MKFTRLILAALVALAMCGAAFAQIPGVEPSANTEQKPAAPAPDSLGRDTPAGMVSGFLDAMATSNYELAAQYLNTSKEGAAFGVRRARQLQRVLDRGGYVYSRLGLSADATGEQADGLPANEDVFGTVRTEKGTVNLVAERVSAPSGGGQIWLV